MVNLSGYPIASYWTDRNKPLLRSSRIESTEAIASAISKARATGGRPRVLVNASAVGIYGDACERVLSEDSPLGDDFLATLCVDWEDATSLAAESGCRVVRIRTGIVLGAKGVLPRMLLASRMYVGGPIGNGRQWVSWVHIADIAGLYRFALEHDNVSGRTERGRADAGAHVRSLGSCGPRVAAPVMAARAASRARHRAWAKLLSTR